MVNSKTATLTFRIDPELKAELRSTVAREHCSVANMIEVLLRRKGLIRDQNGLHNSQHNY